MWSDFSHISQQKEAYVFIPLPYTHFSGAASQSDLSNLWTNLDRTVTVSKKPCKFCEIRSLGREGKGFCLNCELLWDTWKATWETHAHCIYTAKRGPWRELSLWIPANPHSLFLCSPLSFALHHPSLLSPIKCPTLTWEIIWPEAVPRRWHEWALLTRLGSSQPVSPSTLSQRRWTITVYMLYPRACNTYTQFYTIKTPLMWAAMKSDLYFQTL